MNGRFASQFRFTPPIVKWTLMGTLGLTLFTLVFNALFTQVLHLPSPVYFLSLSTWGVHKFFFWQFFSYLFIQPILQAEISLGSILRLFFDLYLLWSIGTGMVQMKGTRSFAGLYYGGALFVGLLAYLALYLTGSTVPFAGATMSIYILLIAWTFMAPDAQLLLFFAFPLRAKWLVFGLIGMNLFLDFSNGHFFSFYVTLGALVYAHFYATLAWEMLSPFRVMHPIDKKLIYVKRKLSSHFRRKTSHSLHEFEDETTKRYRLFRD